MSKTANGDYGERVWNDKIKSQGEVGVIFGTVSSMETVQRETQKFMNFFDKEIKPLIKKNAKILDLGTGPMARFSIELAKRAYSVTGLDISEETLKLAKKYAEKENVKIDFKKMDMTELDPIKERFDLAMCIATFYHVPIHLTGIALIKINSILKKDGFFLVEFGIPLKGGLKNKLKVGLYWAGHYVKRLFGSGFKVNVTRLTNSEIKELADKTGFKIEKQFGPATFLLKKK